MLARKLSRFFTAAPKEIKIPLSDLDPHILPPYITPPKFTTTTPEALLKMHAQMYSIRRLEIECDTLYKSKEIKGFCHLYDGQEGVVVGLENALNFGDPLITAYRNHGNAYMRGIDPYNMFCEVIARRDGSSKGKGGSMHFYAKKTNYYGGNGIVGAQIPVGTGLAFALKYDKNPNKNVCATLYGDGAANQGQLYEAANMAALWKLPIIYIVENNHYAMGTSVERSSAGGNNFHKKLHDIPGLKVDGFNAVEVKEVASFAKSFALKEGPIILNIITYRYHGHSMSDPGMTYRDKSEVSDVRKKKDCITLIEKVIIENGVMNEDGLMAVKDKIKADIAKAKDRALASEHIPPEYLTTDVYTDDFKHFVRAPNYEDSIFVKEKLVE